MQMCVCVYVCIYIYITCTCVDMFNMHPIDLYAFRHSQIMHISVVHTLVHVHVCQTNWARDDVGRDTHTQIVTTEHSNRIVLLLSV